MKLPYGQCDFEQLRREGIQSKEEIQNDPVRAQRGFPLDTQAFVVTGSIKNFYKTMKKFSGFCIDQAFPISQRLSAADLAYFICLYTLG
ncbi:MAG: hypothetical protein ACKO6N_14850 [Myxococcota bacterium]